MSKVIMLLCVYCVTACGRDVVVGENDLDARAVSDAGAFDPCAHPDCANGGQVPLGDGAVLLCQCPKVRGDR